MTVTVTATPPVTIDLFTADQIFIQHGSSTTLRWLTSNATAVTLDGVAVNDDGVMVVSPTSHTTYTLRATGEGGPITRNVTVTVTAIPAGDDRFIHA